MVKKLNNKKSRQCVCCGFNAVRGTLLAPDKFMCRSCEQEAIQADCDRYEDEEWMEVNRIESWLGRCETM